MAKNKKPSAKKGSRITPRKDARKLNRTMMKDIFSLSDRGDELVERFNQGYLEIAKRDDVPAEVLAKMKEFIDKNKQAFADDVIAQDADALAVEKLLDNIGLKWADMEPEVLGLHLGMHMRIEASSAKFAELMSEASEIALEIPDEAPKAIEEAVVVTPESKDDETVNSGETEVVQSEPQAVTRDEAPALAEA